LSLFRGGFDLQAARKIAGASLPILATLVNKSLLRIVSPGHYDLLEPLKQYAALRLAESDVSELTEIEERYGRYYLSFLQAREKQLHGAALLQTLDEIKTAFRDIQAAWRWAVDHELFDLVGQVSKSLFLFCNIRSRFQIGDSLFAYAINQLEAVTGAENEYERQILGRLLTCRGRLLSSWGKFQTARNLLEKSLPILHTGNHSDGDCPERLNEVECVEWMAFNLHSLGALAGERGEYEQAKQYAQECLNLCQNLDSPWNEAWARYVLGTAAYDLGEYAPGQEFIQQSLALHRQISNRHGEASCLSLLGLINCGLCERDAGKYNEARGFFEQDLAIRQTIGDRRGEAAALHNLGYIQFRLGRYNQAEDRFEASLKISEMIGSINTVAATSMWVGLLNMEQQNFSAARRYLTRSLEIAYENDILPRLTDVLYRMGDLLWRTGQYADAVAYLAFVQNHPATDDRVRLEVDELMVKLTAVLSSQTLETAQDEGRARTLEAMISHILPAL
jgi:tetratricopeptide (TPR) repeat protein